MNFKKFFTRLHFNIISYFSLDESLIITNDQSYLPEEDDDEDELHNNHLQNVLLESCAAELSKNKGTTDMDNSCKSASGNPSFIRHMELSKFSSMAKTTDGNKLVS